MDERGRAMRRTKLDAEAKSKWTPAQLKLQSLESVNWGENKLTQQQLADETGIARSTLNEWRRLPGWYAEVDRMIDEATRASRAAVYSALVATAEMSGKEGTADRRLYFQLRGELRHDGVTVNSETHVHNGDDKKLTPEEALRRLSSENGNRVAELVRGL